MDFIQKCGTSFKERDIIESGLDNLVTIFLKSGTFNIQGSKNANTSRSGLDRFYGNLFKGGTF